MNSPQPTTHSPADQRHSLQGIDLQCQREGASLFEPVSFSLHSGESLLLAGPNGIGKTTLLEAIAGLRHYHGGELLWNGTDLRDNPASWRESVCYIGHKDGNKKALTCLENLKFTSRIHGQNPDQDALLDALEAVGLAGYEHHLAGNLSAGQKKRLALARLALVKAPVWILDEPFVNLDLAGCQWLLGWIDAHLGNGGLLLVTAHDNKDMQQRASQRIELESAWPENSGETEQEPAA